MIFNKKKPEFKQTPNLTFRLLRGFLRLDRSEFADQLNISTAEVVKIEKKKMPINADLKDKIAETFNVNRMWVESGKGQIFMHGPVKNVIKGDAKQTTIGKAGTVFDLEGAKQTSIINIEKIEIHINKEENEQVHAY